MGYIYKIINTINGKFYIGKTEKTPADRFKGHLYAAARFKKQANSHVSKNSRLYNAINKYGPEAFTIVVVEEVADISKLNAREIYWISTLDACNRDVGYNIAKGGTGGNTLSYLSPDELQRCKDKMSKSRKGHAVSDETRKKLSEANSGKYYHNEITKEIIRQKNLGRKQSLEERKKHSEGLKKWHRNNVERTKEIGKKISATKKGNVVISEEQRKQISRTLKEYFKTHKPYIAGKQHTEESIQKMSLAKKGRIWIHNTEGVTKMVSNEQLDTYLKLGWIRGRTRG